GEIIDRRVNLGQLVTPAANAPSLFLIAKDLAKMQIWAMVGETSILRVRKGQKVNFTVDALPGKSFSCTVSQVRLNASTQGKQVMYTVVIDVDNQDRSLLPYLTADVDFVSGEAKNVLLIPTAALRWRPGREQVAPAFRDKYAELLDQNRPGMT